MADYEDKKVNDKQFTLFNNESGKSYQIPLIESKDGPNVLDIHKLYQETGLFTFDPGFTSTASCESGITYIDGDKGILRHRGYDIKDLANKSDFLEVCYLLLHGDLPSPEDKQKFEEEAKVLSTLLKKSRPHTAVYRFYITGADHDSFSDRWLIDQFLVREEDSIAPERGIEITRKLLLWFFDKHLATINKHIEKPVCLMLFIASPKER